MELSQHLLGLLLNTCHCSVYTYKVISHPPSCFFHAYTREAYLEPRVRLHETRSELKPV